MNKEEFLKSLTEEQLKLLDRITHTNIINEIKRRNPKPCQEVKVGDCFFYKDELGSIYLIKVTEEEGNDWFACFEVSIEEGIANSYDVNYHIDHCSDWKSIDSKVYDKILALVNVKEDTVNKLASEFDKQIIELCSNLLNTPNKN